MLLKSSLYVSSPFPSDIRPSSLSISLASTCRKQNVKKIKYSKCQFSFLQHVFKSTYSMMLVKVSCTKNIIFLIIIFKGFLQDSGVTFRK